MLEAMSAAYCHVDMGKLNCLDSFHYLSLCTAAPVSFSALQ